jgi:phosphotransferase system HPr-like phosphotransfer protein
MNITTTKLDKDKWIASTKVKMFNCNEVELTIAGSTEQEAIDKVKDFLETEKSYKNGK